MKSLAAALVVVACVSCGSDSGGTVTETPTPAVTDELVQPVAVEPDFAPEIHCEPGGAVAIDAPTPDGMERLPLSGSGPVSAFAASIDVAVTDDLAACGPADHLVFWAGNTDAALVEPGSATALVVALAWRGSFRLDGSGDHTPATTPGGMEVTVGNDRVGFGPEPTLNLIWQDRDVVYSLDAEGVELDVLLDLVDSIVVTG